MTARFAGSRTLDERRRRWLASHETEQPAAVRSRTSGDHADDTTEAAEVRITHFPVRKLISPKGWKIALVGAFALLLGGALVAAGHLGTTCAASLGPGWQRLFPLGGGGLVRLFQASLLILSGQVAVLVWWMRSRSLRDFEGQYHVWLWGAVTVILTGLGLIGGWHWAWSETFCWLSSTEFPQRDVLCWLLPATLAGGMVWKKLRADMRDCRSSSVVFWLVGICYLGACAFRLRLDHSPVPEPTRQLIGTSLQMLASVGVFVSFLAHARFVLHVSVEPPSARPSLWSKMLHHIAAVLKKLPKPRFKFQWKSLGKFLKRSESQSAKSKPPRKEKKAKTQEKTPRPAPSDPEEAMEPQPAPKTANRTTTRRPATKSGSKPVSQEETGSSPTSKESNAKADTKSQSKQAPPKATANSPTKESPSQPKEPPAVKMDQPEDGTESDDQEANSSSPSDERQLRLDQPLDPETLKGLSKKERRRLRKLHKDAQRKK